MLRLFRPRLRITGGPVYALGPIIDTWGAARLIYEKQFTYPLESPFGPGTPVARQYRLTQPAPPFVTQSVFISGVVGVPVGGFYSSPASTPTKPGDFGG